MTDDALTTPRPGLRSWPDDVLNAATVFRYGAMVGFAEFATIFTWRSWLLGWLSRVLCQVAFFALIGRLLGSAATVGYLLIGNAVLIAVLESAFVVASTTWERRAGTLPLLVASPTSPGLVFFSRSVQWIASGTVSASIALFVLAPVFGVPLPLPRALWAVPVIAVVSMSSYLLGLTLAGVVLRMMGLRNVVGNVTWLVVALLAGVQVPPDFWPLWLQWPALVLPARHGLTAVRSLIASKPWTDVLTEALLELAVGLGWLLVAVLTLRRFVEHGRRDGSIEFSD